MGQGCCGKTSKQSNSKYQQNNVQPTKTATATIVARAPITTTTTTTVNNSQPTLNNSQHDEPKIKSDNESDFVTFMKSIESELTRQKNGRLSNSSVKTMQSKIIEKCQITQNQLNPVWDKTWDDSDVPIEVGNINSVIQTYQPPKGYSSIAININKYPHPSSWLNLNTTDQSWIILYHKTIPEAVNDIIQNGFKPGENQAYQNSKCRFGKGKIGTGVYFADNIRSCLGYGKDVNIENKQYHLIFMCRINPQAIKSPVDRKDYFIVADTTQIRPYQLLFKIDKST